MSPSVESISRAPSITPSEATFGNNPTDFRTIVGIIRTVIPRGQWGKWLQRVTGKDQRTCEFWLAGDYQPRGESQRAIVRALRIELDRFGKQLQRFEMDL